MDSKVYNKNGGTLDCKKKSSRKCVVCGPTDLRLMFSPRGITPLTKQRIKEWNEFLGIHDNNPYKENMLFRLCTKHFVDSDFFSPAKKKLTRYAVPSLHPPSGVAQYLPKVRVLATPSTGTPVKTPRTSTPVHAPSTSIPVDVLFTSAPAEAPVTIIPVKVPITSTPVEATCTSTPIEAPTTSTPFEASLICNIFHSYCRGIESRESLKVDGVGESVVCPDSTEEGYILNNIVSEQTQSVSAVRGEAEEGGTPNIFESVIDVEVNPADIYEELISDFEDRTLNVGEKSMSDVENNTQSIMEDSVNENETLETPSCVVHHERSLKGCISEVAEARKTRGEESLDVPCQEITDILLKDKEEDNENNNTLQPEAPIAKPHFIKVLGQQNFQDPSVIKSVLDKVKLKKKGSVFVLPVKKNCNLTRGKLEKIVEELPLENNRIKQKLLTLVRGKSYVGDNKLIPKARQASQQRRIRKSSLSNGLRKRVRRRKTKVSPALKVRIEASSFRENSQQSSDHESFTDFTKCFTLSTILTDVSDKSQIEQLCQLLIKSLFTVKNLNVNGTLSKLEIYLFESSDEIKDRSRKHCEEVRQSSQATSETKKQTQEVKTLDDASFISDQLIEISECVEIPFVDNSACINSIPRLEESALHGKANITVSHDHAYLSGERNTFFEKPPYLVHLINIDSDKPKKSRILSSGPSKTLLKKYENEFVKHRRQISRLKDFLKKKNDYVENVKCKMKYLRVILCKKFGVKHVRYPRVKRAQVDGENDPQEVKEHDPRQVDENAQSEIDTAVQNICPPSEFKKSECYILTPDFVLPSRRKRRKKKSCVEVLESNVESSEFEFDTISKSVNERIILTPDFVVPPARKRRRKKSLVEVSESNIETSQVDFDARLNLFHQSIIYE